MSRRRTLRGDLRAVVRSESFWVAFVALAWYALAWVIVYAYLFR